MALRQDRLQGAALLDFVEQNSKLMSEKDLALEAGYYSLRKRADGQVERVAHIRAFFRATLEAKGTTVSASAPKGADRRFGPKGPLKVSAKGALTLSAAYTRRLEMDPCDVARLTFVELDDDIQITGPCWVLEKEPPDMPEESDDEPEVTFESPLPVAPLSNLLAA